MGKFFNEEHNAIILSRNSVKNYNNTIKDGDVVTFKPIVEHVKYIEYDERTGKEKIRYVSANFIKDLYEQIKLIESDEFQSEYYHDGLLF